MSASAGTSNAQATGAGQGVASIVTLENITREHRVGDTVVRSLDNVSLDVQAGQFVVVLGPSGSGKTSMLNLIGGMDQPTSGRITVAGMDITHLDEGGLTKFRRTQVGFVFQFFNLVPTLTARENVEMVAELTGHRDGVDDALAAVGLGERAGHFPGQLSGGEQQRVSIARALVKDPPLLLCDEPTGELDDATGKAVLSAMRRINRESGKTMLLVTHNSSIARMADRVVRLRSGEVVEDRMVESPLSAEELEW